MATIFDQDPSLLSLRMASEADESYLHELITASIAQETMADLWPPAIRNSLLETQYQARRRGLQAQFPSAVDYIIEARGVSAGYLRVDSAEDAIHLIDFVIAESHRNGGLGTAVLTLLITESEQRQLPIRLSVNRSNPAERLYRRVGFVTLAEDPMRLHMQRAPSAQSNHSTMGNDPGAPKLGTKTSP